MRILFITATRLGDAVLSTGLLAHLLAAYPDASFTIACGPVAEGVFARMPRRDRTIVVTKQRFDRHWLTLWRATVTTRWDLAIDLRGSGLTFFLAARRRAIMRGGRRPGHRLGHIAGVLGLPNPPLPVAWTNDTDRDRAATLLPCTGPLIGPSFIGLGPTANWAGKTWAPERFVALFQAVGADMPDARAVVFGGPGQAERAMAQPVLDALPGAVDLVGALSLPEAAACLARCSLFVGNDSGLMHLAAAAGAPTLGLFGPTPPSEYAPRGRRAGFVAATSMEALSVESALQGARTLITRVPA
jgi:ADP-heptose:LPS heptosyltransferase